MPFIPHNISAVVLYGKKTCNRMVEILNYWQTILVDHAWDRYLFLCVTEENEAWEFPGTGEKTPGTQELLNKQVVRCMHMKIKADQPQTWAMPAGYLEALQFRLAVGHVMVHFVCDDLNEAPPTAAAVSLMESAVSFLGKGDVNCLYYLMLRQNLKARQKQRELALTIHERQPYAVVYLLSNIADNGSRLHKYVIRRAAMCEILVASEGKRHYMAPMVYTLGYTSLNANDQELFFMRQSAIADVLHSRHKSQITKPEAWDLLTMKTGQPPLEYNDYAIPAAVRNWVNGIAEQFVINPTGRELENLRILAGIVTPEAAVGLQDACKKFYEANLTARTDVALRNTVANHINNVIAELRRHINAQGFPEAMLQSFLDALKGIEREKPSMLPIAPQKRKFLQPKDEYLNQCAAAISLQVRTGYVMQAAGKVAYCLRNGFRQVEEILGKIKTDDHFTHAMQEYKVFVTDVDLQKKYPKYAAAVTETIQAGELNAFGDEWLRSSGMIYTEDLKADENAIRKLMKSGVERLHRQMPHGFNSTFMDALHAELDTENTMETFLDKFLFDKRYMFKCPHAIPHIPDESIMYFVDDDLEKMDWVTSKKTNTVMANNDNIEKLSFVRLDKSLQWLAEEWKDENVYFGQHEDLVIPGTGEWFSGKLNSNGSARSSGTPGMSSVQADNNPHNIHLTFNGEKYMLTWNWEADTKAVLVSVNGQPPKPIDAGKYMLQGGMDVTAQVVYGRNEFSLFRVDHRLYGKMSLCGKQYPVRYRFVPSSKTGVQLRLAGIIPPNSNAALLLGEHSSDKRVCFYPVASRGLQGDASYDGLQLAGKYELTVSPEERFPLVKPVQDISL